MKKLICLLFTIVMFACSQQQAYDNRLNAFVRNNIAGYDVEEIVYSADGSEKERKLISVIKLDSAGNKLQEVSPDINYTATYYYVDSLLAGIETLNKAGDVIFKQTTSYKNNQIINTYYADDGSIASIETHYTNFAGKDTLVTRYDTNNQLIYKVTFIYDEIGLKEQITEYSDDTTYYRRINDYKNKHIFETYNLENKLLNRISIIYDAEGREIEFVYEGLMNPDKVDYTHYRTSYSDNGLIDEIIYTSPEGVITNKKKYTYTSFSGDKNNKDI